MATETERTPVFQFEDLGEQQPRGLGMSASPAPLTSPRMSQHLDGDGTPLSGASRKGKAVSIRQHLPLLDFAGDVGAASASSSELLTPSSSPPSSISPYTPFGISMNSNDFDDLGIGAHGKGKEKAELDDGIDIEEIMGGGDAMDPPPSLPPLMFTQTGQDISWADFLEKDQELTVSSPDSATSSFPSSSFSSSSSTRIHPTSPIEADPPPTPIRDRDGRVSPDFRRRSSYPNANPISVPPSTPTSGNSRTLKSRLSSPSSTLARRLLRKRTKSLAVPSAVIVDNASRPWLHERAYSDTFHVISGIELGTSTTATSAVEALQRSQSGVHIYCHDRSFEYDALPTEVQLRIFHCLVAAFVEEHEECLAEGRWDVGKASSPQNRWVGRERGLRELVKLSRVSRSWRALACDGELWADMPMKAFPTLASTVLLHLGGVAGPFVTTLDLAGNTVLTNSTFDALAQRLGGTTTQLTSLNLPGCSKFVTSSSLHALLKRSPHLQYLHARGLKSITNLTCSVVAMSCPALQTLDVRQCANMDAMGIYNLCWHARESGVMLQLRALRTTGLKYIDDRTMAILGERAPLLEVLELSYSRHLHNSALDAFVACDADETANANTVVLHASQVGRDAGQQQRYRRRVTKLRHLNLSSCRLLTDEACSNLAHCVPELQFLELAGLGEDLKDAGLIRLLNTTPKIERLDLEDASALTDDLLAALTPPSASTPNIDWASITGFALRQLTISYAAQLTDNAAQQLIRRCKHLTVLEADNTRLSGSTLQLFVRKARKRQIADARVSVVDCRGVPETLVKELAPTTRPRLGWRRYDARALAYVDGDEGGGEDAQDECDPRRVVVKSYYSWLAVDAASAAREKRRRAASRRVFLASTTSEDFESGRGSRWFGRRSGRNTPVSLNDELNNGEGCTIM